MQLLRTWTFVNLGALATLLASFPLIETPSKVAAEANLLAYLPHAFLAGLAWLLLAVVRFLIIQRDVRQ